MSHFVLNLIFYIKKIKKVMITMCDRELFKQLGEGYSDDFVGIIDGIGGVFFKKGIRYRNVCLIEVRRYGHNEDIPVAHVWVDIIESDVKKNKKRSKNYSSWCNRSIY